MLQAKAVLLRSPKCWHWNLAKYNITANVVAPGFTSTDMLDAIPASILEDIKAKIPLKRFAESAEIAKAVVFLVCDGNSITGQQINVNGGINT